MVNIAHEAAQAVGGVIDHAADEISGWFHRDARAPLETSGDWSGPVHWLDPRPQPGSRIANPETSAAQAAVTAPQPEGTHMSLATDLRDLADKVEPIADDVISHVQALAGNPETTTVISDVASLVGLQLPPTVIANALAPIRALLTAYAPSTLTNAATASTTAAAPAQ